MRTGNATKESIIGYLICTAIYARVLQRWVAQLLEHSINPRKNEAASSQLDEHKSRLKWLNITSDHYD